LRQQPQQLPLRQSLAPRAPQAQLMLISGVEVGAVGTGRTGATTALATAMEVHGGPPVTAHGAGELTLS
jgi:hypothetical protein